MAEKREQDLVPFITHWHSQRGKRKKEEDDDMILTFEIWYLYYITPMTSILFRPVL